MVLKLNTTATLFILGEYSRSIVPIDGTIEGHSYLNLEFGLQDF